MWQALVIDVINYGLNGSECHSAITIWRYIGEISRHGVFHGEDAVSAGEIVKLPLKGKVPEFMGLSLILEFSLSLSSRL